MSVQKTIRIGRFGFGGMGKTHAYSVSNLPSPKAPSGWLRGHVESRYHFLNSVYTGKHSTPDFTDGTYVQSVMEAAYRSVENGTCQSVGGAK